jgi:hypothetical protein
MRLSGKPISTSPTSSSWASLLLRLDAFLDLRDHEPSLAHVLARRATSSRRFGHRSVLVLRNGPELRLRLRLGLVIDPQTARIARPGAISTTGTAIRAASRPRRRLGLLNTDSPRRNKLIPLQDTPGSTLGTLLGRLRDLHRAIMSLIKRVFSHSRDRSTRHLFS